MFRCVVVFEKNGAIFKPQPIFLHQSTRLNVVLLFTIFKAEFNNVIRKFVTNSINTDLLKVNVKHVFVFVCKGPHHTSY